MTRHATVRALAILALAAPGCTALVDSTLAGRGGTDGGMDAFVPSDTSPMHDTGPMPDVPMTDAGPLGPCTGLMDGLRCEITGIAEPFVCIGGVCQLSRCGDGQPDNRMGSMHDAEQCDDGNTIDGDGCDGDCTYSCAADGDCVDHETCNGMETCDTTTTHACVAGTMQSDTTVCTIPGTSTAAVCHGGTCRAGACPDGVHDMGEDCDDNNHVDGDGCDSDCTFSCSADSDCQDGDPCNGAETCSGTHVCQASTQTLDCNDDDTCTSETCVPMTGCVYMDLRVDADHDIHYAMTGPCPGDDCNDANAAIHPGAQEDCSATVDLDCNGTIGTPATWYVDCDGDGFAHSATGSMMSCTRPAPNSGCTSPGWVTTRPTGVTNTDCLDTASSGANAHPGQDAYYSTSGGITPAYDWDCSGRVDRQVTKYGHPLLRDRTFVECAWTGSPFMYCGGTAYWDQATPPACGATGTLSHCVIQLGGCTRVTTTNSVAACH